MESSAALAKMRVVLLRQSNTLPQLTYFMGLDKHRTCAYMILAGRWQLSFNVPATSASDKVKCLETAQSPLRSAPNLLREEKKLQFATSVDKVPTKEVQVRLSSTNCKTG